MVYVYHIVKKYSAFYGTWWLMTCSRKYATVNTFPSYFFKSEYNIFLPSTPVSSKW